MTTAYVFQIIWHHTWKQKPSFRWNRTYWLSLSFGNVLRP